jgi:hypothetical protein
VEAIPSTVVVVLGSHVETQGFQTTAEAQISLVDYVNVVDGFEVKWSWQVVLYGACALSPALH